MSTVLIHPTNGRIHRDDVLKRFPDAEVIEPDGVKAFDKTVASIKDRFVLLTNNDSWRDRYLEALSPGDWVATTATGYNIFPLRRFEEARVALTNMPTIYAEPVSTHAFAMAFSMARRLGDYHDHQVAGMWRKEKSGMSDFGGDVCCVIGLGRIGENIAERASAFGISVRGVKRTPAGYDGAADEVFPPSDITSAMDGARLAFVIVPLTDETRGLVGEAALNALDDEAILVNVARGPVVDIDALIDVLDADEIRGACLDVFDEEPLPETSPLWDRNDVFITPHMAGWSDKLPKRALDVFCDQYAAWIEGGDRPHRLV